ncbi:MAG: UvrD-helicase domain-containing protein [Flavobacteriales bacterium]
MDKNLHIYRSSAGSGKTYSLVRYYIGLALVGNSKSFNPRYFRHILAITFTNKAAAEMKDRVLTNFSDLSQARGINESNSFFNHIKQDTGLSNEVIQNRSTQVLSAILHNYTDLSISTIDKFVYKIVRTFAHDLQLHNAFEVEMDQEQLIQPAVTFLISRIGSDKSLSDALVSFALSNADEGKSYNLENALEVFSKHLFLEKSEHYVKVLKDVSIVDCLQVKDDLLNKINQFESVLFVKRKDFLTICNTNNLESSHFTRKSFFNYFKNLSKRSVDYYFPSDSVKKNVEENVWYAKSVSQDKKDIIDHYSSRFTELFDDIQTHLRKNIRSYIFNKHLYNNIYSIAVLNELSKELNDFKEVNNIKHISEFNRAIADIIRKEPAPFIYERLGERYHHFLIDEFQDTSVMQWHNLLPLFHNSLSEGYQNLIVGDAKQSIYRWRGGEVEQFVQLPSQIFKGELLPNISEINRTVQTNSKEIVLEYNWRSDKEIVNFNNKFFSKIKALLSDDLKSIYKNCQQIPMGNDGGYIHIDLTPKSTDFKEDVMNKIIQQIKHLHELDYEYKDIAILCRTKNEAFVVAENLNKANINVLSDEALLLTASKEVNLLISILCFLQNTSDKLASVHIATYLYHKENTDVDFHSLLETLGRSDQSLFYDYLKSLDIDFQPSLLWELPLYDLIEQLIVTFNLSPHDSYLQYFLDVIHKFSIKSNNDMGSFLEWWEKNNHKEAIVVPDDMNAVKVMTVHKSKGLEFPIVFIPFNWKIAKADDQIWVDAKGKIEKLKVALLQNNKHLKHSEYSHLQEKENQNALMDDVNVLYVAMTRAKHQLYIYTQEFNSNNNSNHLNDLIETFFEDMDTDFPYTSGTLVRNNIKENIENNEFKIHYDSIQNWREVINLKNKSNQLWNVELEKQRWGSLLHCALSNIKYLSDKDKVLRQLELDGLLDKSMKLKLSHRIEELLSDKEIQSFFSNDWIVKTEQEILKPSGETYIPDRVLIKDNQLVLIDYKTGTTSKMQSHKKQIDNYANTLHSMGYNHILKTLIYTEEDKKLVQW